MICCAVRLVSAQLNQTVCFLILFYEVRLFFFSVVLFSIVENILEFTRLSNYNIFFFTVNNIKYVLVAI